MVKGDSDGTDPKDAGAKWVEVKSLTGYKNRRAVYNKTSWQPWDLSKQKYSYHRQFYLDRVGNTSINELPEFKKSSGFEWWLQDFRKRTVSGFDRNVIGDIAKDLKELPTGDTDITKVSVNNDNYSVNNVKDKVRLGNIKNLIVRHAKDIIFRDADPELVQKLFDEVE